MFEMIILSISWDFVVVVVIADLRVILCASIKTATKFNIS